MSPDKVDEMLGKYRAFLGRCKHLEELIRTLEYELEWMKSHIVEDTVSIGGQEMDGMPHGTSPGKPTERLAVMIASGFKPDFIIQQEKDIAEAKSEYIEKKRVVSFVEAWLAGLTDRERWIVVKQVIDGVTWRELVPDYSKEFGETRTKRGLQMLRDRAVEKIYDIAA